MGFVTGYFNALPVLDGLSIILSALFVGSGIYIMMKTGWLKARVERIDEIILKSESEKKKMEKAWEGIERNFFSGNDDELKLAVLKADALFDEALRDAGVSGKDLGERLRKIKPALLPNLDNVWEAHKLRNRIAHETNFTLKRDLAERALTVYEEALEHLEMLPPMPPVTEQ